MLEENIKKAVRHACEEYKQSEELADLLITWLDQVAQGNEEIHDENSYRSRLRTILPEINLDGGDL